MICNNQLSTVQAVCKQSFKPAERLHVLRRPVRERSQQASRRCRRCSRTPVQTKAAGDVFALDFDGVMVDSEPEVSELVARQSTAKRANCVIKPNTSFSILQISSSAVAAAAEYWPEQFGNLDQATHDQLRRDMRQVRPVLVNGVEALVMVFCCSGSHWLGQLHVSFDRRPQRLRFLSLSSCMFACRPGWCLKTPDVLTASYRTGRACCQQR